MDILAAAQKQGRIENFCFQAHAQAFTDKHPVSGILPYVTAPGSVTKALAAIQAAAKPPRVGIDFIHEVLKIPGSSGRQIGTWLKRTGFVGVDDVPTALYERFKTPGEARAAAAEALRIGYAGLFARAADAHELADDQLRKMIQDEMKLGLGSNVITLVLACFKGLRAYAQGDAQPQSQPHGASPRAVAQASVPPAGATVSPSVRLAFDAALRQAKPPGKVEIPPANQGGPTIQITPPPQSGLSGLRASAAYTIYLSLPATSDATVFSAIFQSLKDTLLS